MQYKEFLQTKAIKSCSIGMTPGELSSALFEWQKMIVGWALQKGKAALFCDCGMGKTFMQLEWAKHIDGKVLILAPLAVAQQTVREGEKFGIDLSYARKGFLADSRITITNYEMLQHFNTSEYDAVVLDESSILKSFDGKYRTEILEAFSKTPYRLACTATPAPNDYMELGNHAQFLGVMTATEMLSTFFVHDAGETQKWRLKGHAEDAFWKWISSWAINIRSPKDLGFSDDDFKLPELKTHEIVVQVDAEIPEGQLFAMPAATLAERLGARKDSVDERAKRVAEIVATKPNEPWVVWCNLNSEADAIRRLIPDAKEIRGSDSIELKESRLHGFSSGEIRVLVSKASICGFGLNWQHCANVVFCGLSDSFEQYYQALRRCWRFGQKNTVNSYVVISEFEGAVLKNIIRKEADAMRMAEEMKNHMLNNFEQTERETDSYQTGESKGAGYDIFHGDCVEYVTSLPDESIHYSMFSPPFASLYTYSNSDRDMGNSRTYSEFFLHFQFLIKELHRVLKSGRLVSFHCMNLPTSKQHHGYIGIQDFRGDLIRAFQDAGFIYHSEVCIWKDPVIAMQRTKALGLLHKQLKKDSAMSRQGVPDYVVTMRKPGTNPEPVTHTNESFPVQIWQQYASPIWMDIVPGDTLQYMSAREHDDERHICPLQLTIIKRCMDLWTNPGDTVLSPFMGIGSEGYVALKMGRKFRGSELKESYFKQAAKNLHNVTQQESLL